MGWCWFINSILTVSPALIVSGITLKESWPANDGYVRNNNRNAEINEICLILL